MTTVDKLSFKKIPENKKSVASDLLDLLVIVSVKVKMCVF